MPTTAFTTGPKYPTTTTTPNLAGTEGNWSNPANIFADDGSNASDAYWSTAKGGTDELNGAGFGMGIPSNAIIDGIKLEMEVASSNRWGEPTSTMKLKKAGSLVGNNKAGTGTVSSGVYTYGGSTDLWGTTWTPAEINAANFGFGFVGALTSSPNDFSLAIDFVRITVYWHYDNSVSPADVPTKYIHKVLDPSGSYMGVLPAGLIISEFGIAQDINSAGSSYTIELGKSIDTSGQEVDYLVTEAGDRITTEAGDYIRIERKADALAIGTNTDPTMLVRNGNKVLVYEYSYYYPNGKLVFRGQINRIEAGFGDAKNNTIKLLVLSDGIDLDNFIARGAPFAYTADVTQNTQNGSVTVSEMGSKGAGWNRYGQTWAVGPAVTKLGAITLLLNGTADVTVTVYDGLSGSALGSVTQAVNTGGAAVATQFGFANLITVNPNGTYFFAISVGGGQSIVVYYSSSNPYANGGMYNSNYGGGSGGGSYSSVVGSDLYFIASSGTATTTTTYSSKDPSTEMLKPIIDDYRLRGGVINYSSSSVDATGLSLSVTFNTDTIYDAIKRIMDVSPSTFYWWVDLGTNTIYFKQMASSAEYKLYKGRHLSELNLVLSIENVKNNLLFSGGATSGVNLYKQYQDQSSQTRYGVRLDRKSDNRVTQDNTADAIGSSFINERKGETYQTTIKLIRSKIDVHLLTPGKILGFRGFGTLADGLTMQIVRRELHPHYAVFTLGVLPQRLSLEIEDTIRGLVAEQTVANPSAPS